MLAVRLALKAFPNSSPEGFVLGVEAPAADRAGDGFPEADELVGGELLSGQVQFQSVAETVPPVVIDPRAVAVNSPSHQVATEEIVEDESGGAALASCRVVRVPAGDVFRGAGVSTPRSSDRTFYVGQGPEDHAPQLSEAHRQRGPASPPSHRPARRSPKDSPDRTNAVALAALAFKLRERRFGGVQHARSPRALRGFWTSKKPAEVQQLPPEPWSKLSESR